MLRALLATYLDRVPVEVSPLGRYSDDETLDAVHVAWAGPTEPGAPHYYRLQGPRLLIEWDNTQRGANHAHSVWRDPTADFGLDVLAAHRAAHHEPRRSGGPVPVVPLKEILDRAFADRYGVAAFNILDDLTIDAVLAAAEEERAPVILQTSVKTVRAYGRDR